MKLKITSALLLFILLLSFSGITKTTAEESPVVVNVSQELRGVWVTPITGELSTYTSEAQFKTSMEEMFTVLEHYNINALFFHVRTHNNALYDSVSNPTATWFSNVDFGTFDPLEWLISETKSRGLEFHAWMNPYRVDSNYYGDSLPASNPAASSSNLLSYSGKDILNPGLPLVREFVIDSVMELVENYDVDAIHFDDYFYINLGANGATSGVTTILDEPDQSTFELYKGTYNTSSAVDKAEWRRDQINILVSGVKAALGEYNELNNDYIQFGIAPTGIYKNGNGVVTYDVDGKPITSGSNTGGQTHYSSYLFSDSLAWISEGMVDYLIPQSYWATNHPSAGYSNVMGWWNDVNKYLDINIYSGIGVYMANSGYNTYAWQSDTSEFVNQLSLLDSYENISGSSVYSYQYLDNAYQNITSTATTQINNVEAVKWNNVSILPELKSMVKLNITEKLTHSISDTYIEWNRLSDAKNYYIFASNSPLQYTSNEIVGVVGQQSTATIQYEMNANPNYYYGILPISKTNTLGSPSTVEGVNMIPGASIRTTGVQGLKYQAEFDNSLLSNERGFYVVYGEATTSDLLSVMGDDPMMLNGKPVYKNNSYNQTSKTISVVLTDIPTSGYGQDISVFSYSYDGTDYTFVPTGVTRSIGEVAVKSAIAGFETSVSTVLSELDTNYYTHYIDEFGNYNISSMYETDRVRLRAEFISDWNTMFSTSWTTIESMSFHSNAKTGAVSAGNISGSNIYQFFNDPSMSTKWGWFLEYIKSQDGTVWTSRQILAIQGDGTLSGYSNLYQMIHLNYSVVNFFNNDHDTSSGYSSIDCTQSSRYAPLVIYNQSIYISEDTVKIAFRNETMVLPESDLIEGYTITGFDDGVTVYEPEVSYNFSGYKILQVQKVEEANSITYHLNDGDFYDYISRDEMVTDFLLDFNTQSGLSLTTVNFYDGTYSASTNYVMDFFDSVAYSAKWDWLKTYVLNTGTATSYASQSNLTNNIASTWRSNMWGFINEQQRTIWPASIDFSVSANANGFWSSIEKTPTLVYPDSQVYILEVPFKLNYTFEGWYEHSDFSGSVVSSIPSSESGTKVYYAKWS